LNTSRNEKERERNIESELGLLQDDNSTCSIYYNMKKISRYIRGQEYIENKEKSIFNAQHLLHYFLKVFFHTRE
jgi:hypothetical protein